MFYDYDESHQILQSALFLIAITSLTARFLIRTIGAIFLAVAYESVWQACRFVDAFELRTI